MNDAISQAARILRDKRTGIVDDRAFTTLKHAEEYLWNQAEQGQWLEQAQAAIAQGQNENDFVAHCHPDNRSTARRAYRKASASSTYHPTCTFVWRANDSQ